MATTGRKPKPRRLKELDGDPKSRFLSKNEPTPPVSDNVIEWDVVKNNPVAHRAFTDNVRPLEGRRSTIRLMQGDCLERMKEIPDGSVDLVLTDPPYGTTACKWDSVIPFEPMWAQYERVIKDNGAIVLTSSQPFTTALINSNIKLFKYCWYWEKDKGTGFAFSGKQPLRKIEEICVFYKRQPKYDSQGEKLDKPYARTLPIKKSDSGGITSDNLNPDGSRKYAWYTHKKKHNLLYFSRDNANRGVHPTQKPVALLEYLIKTYTNEGETVLDSCMGSGTTGVACVKTKRDFIGIELDDVYFKIAEQRIMETEPPIF